MNNEDEKCISAVTRILTAKQRSRAGDYGAEERLRRAFEESVSAMQEKFDNVPKAQLADEMQRICMCMFRQGVKQSEKEQRSDG